MKNSSKLLAVLLALIIAVSSVTIVSRAETTNLSESGANTDTTESGVGSVESAVTWAINIANDDSHGYSQSRRTGPDYDCSSFVSTAYRQAGFNLSGEENTGTMINAFTKAGFTWIPASSIADFPSNSTNLLRGDVLMKSGHTEMYIGNNKLVGAHHGTYENINDEGHPGDQSGDEISVTTYSNKGWTGILRYEQINAIDLGTKFYANIVATETQSKSVATTGANYEVAEIGSVTLLWPVEGHTQLSQNFAQHGYKAIDIMDSNINGATIRAAIGGKVVETHYCTTNHSGEYGDCGGFGTGMIIFGDDGRYYWYGHMQGGSIPNNVYTGATVTQGQIIGKVGNTGNSSGSHLHFKISTKPANGAETCYNPEPGSENYIYSMISPQDLGTKFYANIVATNANTLAVTATSSSNVQLNTLTYSDYQKWYFERQSDKSYKITNVKMNKCLDVAGADPADRTNIQVVASNGNDAQRWYFVKYGAGYRLIPKMNTGSALDITGSKLVDGANSIEYHIDEGSELQRYSIIKTHTISYDANGGTGTIANTTIWPNASFKIKDNAFSREGYTFAGYYVKRSSDNTWFVTSEGWVTTGVYRTNNYRLRLYSPNDKYNLDTAWTKGASENDTFTFYAQWIPNESKIRFVENYSGFNYLLGSDLAEDYSDYISSRTDIYTLTVDTNERLNNKNTLKIIGQSAGSSGNDLRMRTSTNIGYGDTYSPVGIAGDNKTMTLRFYAKSSVDGAKFYVRWGYQSGYKSITLTKEWKEYSIAIPKSNYYNDWLHPYFDKAGTFYINSMTLSDGTNVTNINSESGRWACEPITISRGSTIPELPIPERDGYTFLGWYTAAEGGEKVTENTLIDALDITLYAHWLKDISYTPIKTVESNGHRYDLYDNAMGWKAAESFCESLGGHLITINTAEEESIASQMIDDQYRFLWIGMQYNLDSTSWEWVTGEDITYTNWRANRPNTQNGSTVTVEEFGMMFPPSYAMGGLFGQWDDNNGDDSYSSWYGYHNSSFICEYDNIVPESIELSDDELSLEVGEKYKLTVLIEPDDADDTIIWSSDNPDAVRVNDRGIIFAIDEGEAWISATTVNGFMARCLVTVAPHVVEPTDIFIYLPYYELYLGETIQAEAVVYPDEADQNVIWDVEDESVATVDEVGFVTAVGEGKTNLWAYTSNRRMGTAREITVTTCVFPTNPDYIEWNGFTGYINEEGTICIDNYIGSEKDITIPSEIDGIAVTEIMGIYSNQVIESVIIPNSIDKIWSFSFSSCPNLKSVSVSAKNLANWVFCDCPQLSNVSLSEDLEFIGSGSFTDCPELREVMIPKSVETLQGQNLGFIYVQGEEEGVYYPEALDDFVIRGYKNSAAEAYTKENEFIFIALDEAGSPVLGDTDGDGKVTILDANAIQRNLADLPTEDYDEIAADVDGDGKVTIIDATMIQRWLAGLLTDDRIGQLIREDDPDDDEDFSYLNDKPSCPECGSDNVAYIIYGEPLPDEEYSAAFCKKLEDGEIIFGGCEVGFDSPKWHCNKCGHDIQ